MDRTAGSPAAVYELERELGRGGMATVYLAHDRKHDRKVAIKVLHPDLAALVGAERFLSEIRVTAHLQHPHILGLIDSGVFGPPDVDAEVLGGEPLIGRPYYVMPYVEGESLRGRLRREGQLPVADALRITREVASGLEYAHRHGVVHRDVKPENILLGDDGQALISDFGIALAVQHAGGTRLTESGLSLGTPQYMSPEQGLAERQITVRADVYALGAVLYEMLAGEPPFTGPSTQAILARVLTDAPRSITAQRPSVPAHVAAAVQTALEKLPADRFASANAFARALDAPTLASEGRMAATSRGRSQTSRRAVNVLAILAVIAGLVAAGVAAGRRWPARATAAAPAAVRSTLLPPSGEQFAGGDGLAFSSDGAHLAFTVERTAPRPRLFVRTLASGIVRELAGTGDAHFPFWSPDGRAIGFFAEGELRRVPADGGPVTTITKALAPKGGTWAPDGTILFAADPGVIYRVGAGGGPAVAVTKRGPEGVHVSPIFLPDGRRFLFAGQWHTGVFLGDLRTGAIRLIRRDASNAVYVPPGYLLFSVTGPVGHGRWVMAQPFDTGRAAFAGEATMVSDSVWMPQGVTSFAVSATGLFVYQSDPGYAPLAWLDRRGGTLDSMSAGDAWTFRISHGGGRVAQGGFGLWVRDVRRGVTTKLSTPGSDYEPDPVWSPDDARIAYAAGAYAGAYQQIQVARVDGSGKAATLPAPSGAGNARPLDWSPNGRLLLVATDATEEAPQPALWLGDTESRVMTRWQTVSGSIPNARFSPDGRWIAYQSNETGSPEVYLRPFPGPGAAVRVSPAGGGRPAWRADGRELFYLTPGGDLIAAPVAPRGLPDVGLPRQLVPRITDDPYQAATPYDPSPDGQRILVRTKSRVRPPLTLLSPWTLRLTAAPR